MEKSKSAACNFSPWKKGPGPKMNWIVVLILNSNKRTHHRNINFGWVKICQSKMPRTYINSIHCEANFKFQELMTVSIFKIQYFFGFFFFPKLFIFSSNFNFTIKSPNSNTRTHLGKSNSLGRYWCSRSCRTVIHKTNLKWPTEHDRIRSISNQRNNQTTKIQTSKPPTKIKIMKLKESKLPASTSAGVTQDHDGRSGSAGLATGPALAHVGAAGLFADRVEVQLAELFLDLGIFGTARDRLLHPFGLRERLLLGSYLDGIIIGSLEADKVWKGGGFNGKAMAEGG